MKDPLRIESTLKALQQAWEGQPDLSLGQLLSMATDHTFGWGTEDEEIANRLQDMAANNPAELPIDDGKVRGAWLLQTDQPRRRVSIDGQLLISRALDAQGRPGQPTVWEYSHIRPTGPYRRLMVTDCAGCEHSMGITVAMRRLPTVSSELGELKDLTGLRRLDMGERVYLLQTSEGSVVLDHGVHVFSTSRRQLHRRDFGWEKIEQGTLAQQLTIVGRNGVVEQLGELMRILVAE